MSSAYLAVINRAAGGGRCGKLADQALRRLRGQGIDIDVAETRYSGHGIELARDACREGYHRFIAVGGDGTSYEIVNGVFPRAQDAETPVLAFQPLGTGNSFLRDFSDNGLEHATSCILAGRERPCDVLRMTHRDGVIHYINLLSMGFAADVATLTNKRFKKLGQLGYLLGVFACLTRLQRRRFPLQVDGEGDVDQRRHLFLTFNNSKFTGGKMMIAPMADTADGLVEYVRWGPIGRVDLVRNLNTLYDGSHLKHPLASRAGVRRIDFHLQDPVDVMVDGEVVRLHCERLEVLPSALRVVV